MERGVVLSVLVFALALALPFVSLPVLGQECLTPSSGMIVNATSSLCAGEFTLSSPIIVSGVQTTVRCDGTVLQGAGGTGIVIEGDDEQLQGCVLRGFDVGWLTHAVCRLEFVIRSSLLILFSKSSGLKPRYSW